MWKLGSSLWEMLVCGGNFFGRKFCLFFYIKTHNKLRENWPASREINIFFPYPGDGSAGVSALLNIKCAVTSRPFSK